MSSTIKTALVGYGLGGKCFHAPFIASNPNYELVSVVERHRNESTERYPKVHVARSIEDVLQDPSIDLVVVTTPNETHYPYGKMALEAGKNVVLDKPMTVTSAQGAELIALAKKMQKILCPYQNRRFASDARTIKKVLDLNVLGDLITFEATYNRYRPELKQSWKETPVPGSGILYDLGAHLIDQALQLFGKPKAITADIRKQRIGTEADDYFDLWFHYDKLKVSLKAGMIVREQGPRYQLHGTKGSFLKYGDDPQDGDARAGMMPTDPKWGLESEELYGLLHTETDKGVIKERVPSEKGDFGIYYQLLAEALLQGGPLPATAEEGVEVVRMIELARESSVERKTILL